MDDRRNQLGNERWNITRLIGQLVRFTTFTTGFVGSNVVSPHLVHSEITARAIFCGLCADSCDAHSATLQHLRHTVMTMSKPSRVLSREFVSPKVPHVAAAFWAIKLLTTGMGEAASDALGGISVVLAAVVGLGGFLLALGWQLKADTYRPVRYWSAVAMVAVFGTMAADAVHLVGLPYPVVTGFYALAVIVLLLLWRRVEGSDSIHSITTVRRELFYWATVLATFALGTAAGDFTAETLHLGFFESILVFAALMVIPLIGWTTGLLGAVAAFWVAYVLTRPLGASVADWLGKPSARGGLDLTDGAVTLGMLVIFAAAVVWLERTRVDYPRTNEPA